MAEQKQTRVRAKGNGNKKPDMIDRNIEPGTANVCRLHATKIIIIIMDKHRLFVCLFVCGFHKVKAHFRKLL
jgi:hypothetical protein